MRMRANQPILSLLAVLLFGPILELSGQDLASVHCDATILDRANSNYEIGLFDETVDELQPCLPDGLEQKEERVGAYRLMALSYIATDSLDQAKESIRQLLKTDSGYKPDLENDPPLYADMIEGMKPEWYTFMWKGSSPSRWMGRAAVVGAVVAVPFLLQDNSAPPLPGPPDLPTGANQ